MSSSHIEDEIAMYKLVACLAHLPVYSYLQNAYKRFKEKLAGMSQILPYYSSRIHQLFLQKVGEFATLEFDSLLGTFFTDS